MEQRWKRHPGAAPPPFEEAPPGEQVRRLRRLVRTGLAAYGLTLPRLVLVQRLVNTTFRGTAGADRWGVRVHAGRAAGQRLLAAAEVEAAWLEALERDTPLAVPTPRRAADGRAAILATAPGVDAPRVVTVHRWVAGRPVPRSRRGAGYYAALGRVVATLHRHSRGWRHPARFTRPRLDSTALQGGADAARAVIGAWAWLPAPVRRDLQEAYGRLRTAEARLGENAETFGLVHGDLSFGNVLRTPAGALTPIDFGDCGLGYFVADAAVPLAGAFGFGAAGFRVRRSAFLRGYREVAAFPPAWEALLPTFMAGRATALALWAAVQPAGDPARAWIEAQWHRVRALLAYRQEAASA